MADAVVEIGAASPAAPAAVAAPSPVPVWRLRSVALVPGQLIDVAQGAVFVSAEGATTMYGARVCLLECDGQPKQYREHMTVVVGAEPSTAVPDGWVVVGTYAKGAHLFAVFVSPPVTLPEPGLLP